MKTKESTASLFKVIIIALLTTATVFFLGLSLISCGDEKDPEPAQPPTISSFTPTHGIPGETITQWASF